MKAIGRPFSQCAMTTSSKVIAALRLLILVCIGTLSYWSEVCNEADRGWVTQTLHVVEQPQAVRIDITHAETGHRGYMLTGQDQHLQLYEASVTQVRLDLKELSDLCGERGAYSVTLAILIGLV
jgi:CHASE3 domain sensor protein